MNLGKIWWADLLVPGGSEPGYRRPVVVIQSNNFNRSRIRTVVVAAISSNTGLAAAPGNVALGKRGAGLSRDSVVNVSQILTLDKAALTERSGRLSAAKLREVQDGLRLVFAL